MHFLCLTSRLEDFMILKPPICHTSACKRGIKPDAYLHWVGDVGLLVCVIFHPVEQIFTQLKNLKIKLCFAVDALYCNFIYACTNYHETFTFQDNRKAKSKIDNIKRFYKLTKNTFRSHNKRDRPFVLFIVYC